MRSEFSEERAGQRSIEGFSRFFNPKRQQPSAEHAHHDDCENELEPYPINQRSEQRAEQCWWHRHCDTQRAQVPRVVATTSYFQRVIIQYSHRHRGQSEQANTAVNKGWPVSPSLAATNARTGAIHKINIINCNTRRFPNRSAIQPAGILNSAAPMFCASTQGINAVSPNSSRSRPSRW